MISAKQGTAQKMRQKNMTIKIAAFFICAPSYRPRWLTISISAYSPNIIIKIYRQTLKMEPIFIQMVYPISVRASIEKTTKSSLITHHSPQGNGLHHSTSGAASNHLKGSFHSTFGAASNHSKGSFHSTSGAASNHPEGLDEPEESLRYKT